MVPRAATAVAVDEKPSPGWDKAQHLRPRLPAHATLQPRRYGRDTWYVLHDGLTNQFHRLNSRAFGLVARMDGKRSLNEIHASLAQLFPQDTPPSPAEIMQLLQYLHAADLLVTDVPPNTADVHRRRHAKRHQKFKQWLQAPYVLRLPLGNPNAWLNRWQPAARLLTSPIVAFVWLLTVGAACVQAFTHWSELGQQGLHEILTPTNLLLLWLIYPLLKLFHEAGHALFTKAFGGQVYECGVVFILGTPLPYVDATAATGFSAKRRRLLVSAAGMAVELFIASLALFLWFEAEPGAWRNLLLNVMLLGGVSTLLFNGNPLMRFDGYYLLGDLLDQPNLAQRAQHQLRYLLQTKLLRVPAKAPAANSLGERTGLTLYALAAVMYRLVIMAAIVVLATMAWPPLGLTLAAWLACTQLVWPLIKLVRYIMFNAEIRPQRRRAATAFTLCTLALALLVGAVPLPYHSDAQGVVWLADDGFVRAEGGGVVSDVLVADGERVVPGQRLVQLYNPELEAQLLLQDARLREYEVRYQRAWLEDRHQLQLAAEDIRAARLHLAHLQKQVATLAIVSPVGGMFKSVKHHALPGSYVHPGETIGLILQRQATRVRTALKQEDVARVGAHTQTIELKPASRPNQTWQGDIVSDVPNGSFTLPSAALGTAGGGNIAVAADSPNPTRTTEEVFLLDIAPRTPLPSQVYGERVHVRFRFQSRPLAHQISQAFGAWLQQALAGDLKQSSESLL